MDRARGTGTWTELKRKPEPQFFEEWDDLPASISDRDLFKLKHTYKSQTKKSHHHEFDITASKPAYSFKKSKTSKNML